MLKGIAPNSLLVAFLFGLILLIGVPARAAGPSGSFSCLGKTEFSVNFGPPTAPDFSNTELVEMMHLNIGATGGAPGTVSINYFAEVCTFNITALAFAVNATGQGTLAITFNPNIPDADKDVGCAAWDFIKGATSITQKFLVTTAASNTKFFFMGNDGSVSGTGITGDNGDFFAPSGECDHQ